MSEFIEVMKNKERMCESFSDCNKCPLSKSNVRDCIGFHNIEETEKIIMEWAREHPVITNREKFNEVFGMEIRSDVSCPFTCGERENCTNCPYNNFWNKEYEEPKE